VLLAFLIMKLPSEYSSPPYDYSESDRPKSEERCEAVRKWARGEKVPGRRRKKGFTLNSDDEMYVEQCVVMLSAEWQAAAKECTDGDEKMAAHKVGRFAERVDRLEKLVHLARSFQLPHLSRVMGTKWREARDPKPVPTTMTWSLYSRLKWLPIGVSDKGKDWKILYARESVDIWGGKGELERGERQAAADGGPILRVVWEDQKAVFTLRFASVGPASFVSGPDQKTIVTSRRALSGPVSFVSEFGKNSKFHSHGHILRVKYSC